MADMKIVYTLRNKLERDPEHVRVAQALTLNKGKPSMGLKGAHGLYGSEEWWRNVDKGAIRRARYSGVIRELYVAGQDGDTEPNSFRIESNDGVKYGWGIVADEEADKALYQVGRWAEVETIFDELKRLNPDGSPTFLEHPLRISLSTEPVA